MKPHVYVREFDPEAEDSLAAIARCIPEGSVVLDVGTGSGALGRYLTHSKRCIVDGTTMSVEEEALAAPGYRRISIVNLEQTRLSSVFLDQKYDCIVCADVLEHLRTCDEVLEDIRGLLAPQGKVLISVPNVLYAGVMYSMLLGRFIRTKEGILDDTHVKFFERQSLASMLERNGFSIVGETPVLKSLAHTEFQTLPIEELPEAVRSYVATRPDAAVFQFVLSAVALPGAEPAVSTIPVLASARVRPQFMAQIYPDLGAGFSESFTQRQYGYADAERQTLCFPFSEGLRDLKGMRIDFCDREGVFRWYALRVCAPDGSVLWRWNGRSDGLNALGGLEIIGGMPDEGCLLWAHSSDSWLAISLPRLEFGGAESWSLELELSPPRLYDTRAYHVFHERLVDAQQLIQLQTIELNAAAARERDRAKQIETLQAEFHKTIVELNRTQVAWEQMQNEMRRTLEDIQFSRESHEITRTQLTSALVELAEINAQRTSALVELAEINAQHTASREESRAYAAQLQSILSSRYWRAAEPVRRMYRMLRKLING